MVQLREAESQFNELGFQIIAVSPDQPAKVRETVEKYNIHFTLLSDSQMIASRAFGIAYKVDETTLKALAQHGVNLEAASGECHHELPVPAVFLVTTEGVIQFEYINPDYSVRAHLDVLLAAARVSKESARSSR